MADADEPTGPLALRMRPSFPGMRQLWRRFGGRKPPRFDGTKSRIEYRPCFRVVEWYGLPTDTSDPHVCEDPPHCSVPGGQGRHSEVRPYGLDWGEVHFSCLEEALANQAFHEWYENGGGKAVVDKGKMTLYAPYYDDEGKPPLPEFNFFLHEHVHEMSAQEIRLYQREGFVPKRFRRRGRSQHEESHDASITD